VVDVQFHRNVFVFQHTRISTGMTHECMYHLKIKR
jgi:hypothetical protein